MPKGAPGHPTLSVIIPALHEAENLRGLPAPGEISPDLRIPSEVIAHIPPDPRPFRVMGCQLLEARDVGFSEWIGKSQKVGPCAARLAVPTWG